MKTLLVFVIGFLSLASLKAQNVPGAVAQSYSLLTPAVVEQPKNWIGEDGDLRSYVPFADVPYIQFSTAGTGGTITCDDTNDNMIVIHEAVALALTLSIVLPTTPRDGQRVTIVSVSGITALTMSTPVGSAVNLLTGLLGGAGGTYMWSTPKNKWYKIR